MTPPELIQGERVEREDETDRHRTLRTEQSAIRAELAEAQARVRAFRAWITLAVSVGAAVAAVVIFMFATFAKASIQDDHEKRISETERSTAVQDRAILSIDKKFDKQHGDIGWIMRHMVSDAKARHIEVEPMPVHDSKPQP